MPNRSRKILNKVLSAGLAIGMVGSLAACGGSASTSPGLPTTQNSNSKNISGTSPDVTVGGIFGGGSSLVSLVARSLMDNYGVGIASQPSGPVNPGVQLLYASIGSGAGLTAFLTQTPSTNTPTNPPPPTSSLFPNYPYPEWDYTMSDAPLSSTQISQYQSSDQTQRGPAVEVPVTSDGVATPYNPSGLTVPSAGLQLSVNTLCGIFTGGITNWNDSHITSDNNGVQVSSNLPILVVYRADGSGTTFLLSNHENTACASTQFPWTFGVGTTVTWPVGPGFDGETGSQGVAGKVAATAGAIGYVGPSFLGPPNNIPAALLQDNFALNNPSSKQFIKLGTKSIIKALAQVSLPNGFTPTDILNDTIVPDPSGSGAWPIAGFTYADFYGCYAKSKTTKGITGYIKWTDSTSSPQGKSVADKAILAGGLVYLPTKLKQKSVTAMKGVLTGPIGGVCTL
ncbi:MAG TPA: substrate-binding domain-containing protein [Candidatus Eremiobacteraceae bacterium]|nr:substrate-binding domain-containing protein [Candidatus Eremiobacteraceae bacterium]